MTVLGALRGLVVAGRFLTRVRLPGRAVEPSELAPAVAWFPVVGALCGVATACVVALAARSLGLDAGVVAGLAFTALLTGAFHEDGLADAADGLGGGSTRERVLEIMRDSRIGSYGAVALVLLYLARFVLAKELGIAQILFAYPIAGALARASSAALMASLPNARADGLAEGAARGLDARTAARALIAASIVAAALGGPPGLALLAAGAAATAAAGLYFSLRLGGVSGDCLGAANVAVEAAALACAVALLRAGHPLSPVWRP